MMKDKKIIILSIVGVLLLVSIVVATSYAYFVANVSGNKDTNNVVITNGVMSLEYKDGDEITLANAVPGNSVTKTFTVKNTGKKAGDEVVQLYIRDDFSSVTTYDKVLRGFERIHLQPGEEQTISFTLTPQDLGLWDKNNRFTVEPGSFSVMVGASSQDIRLKGSFEVQ